MLDQRCLLMPHYTVNALRRERREAQSPHHSETLVKYQDSNGARRAR